MSDKIKKFSEAMRIGATFVEENMDCFLVSKYVTTSERKLCGCAMGSGYAMLLPSSEAPDGLGLGAMALREVREAVAERFGLSIERQMALSGDHACGRKTRAQIIAELEAEGL